ncbi:uncharacterized protein LOC107265869 [Cephus cinctus]|uniref:alpha-glucosidase n=1 Tax=Cephus cinctus TaxID=211228 RepID=A0AAJ7RDK0_CEPCN|nr:uncharacterized protein LOC107265869 [Cephus cinctus]
MNIFSLVSLLQHSHRTTNHNSVQALSVSMLSVRSILLLLGTFVLLSGKGSNADLENKEWWENTIVYQIWLRGFQDSDGDGEGDIRGIINRLDHLEQLGLETIWLSPIYTSPLIDSGYDVSDYVNINPLFGTLDDFNELVEKAHDKDLKVMLDVVPNHSSDEHYWFNASVHSVEPYTSYYTWANGTVVNGTNVPPNNWISTYSTEAGSAWTWNEIRQQWYYHKFHRSQPDLNLRNAAVVQELLNILTFWLERDVDGFHFSSASYLFENEELLDEPTAGCGSHTSGLPENSGLLYEIHAHIADWITSSNSTSKLLIAGSDDDDNTLISYYGNDTHTGISPFNYRLIKDISANTNASTLKAVIEEWLELLPANHSTNWVLSNHDHSRVPSRISLNHVDGLHILSFLLPGQTFTYYGEEIGMLDTTISWNQTIDPLACAQTQDTYTTYSRDPARTPMQWDTTTSAGFSTNNSTYLPVNSNYLTRNVETQLNHDLANIQTFKALASLKKKATITHGDYEISAVNNDRVLVLKRSLEGYSTYVAVINLGLARQTVNLTELYSDVPEYLYIAVASNNAVTNSTMISVDTVILTANAALVLTDEEPENTTEPSTATPDIDLDNQVIEGNLDWWQSAVIYQIYPKSFQDSNNDGTGDLPGIISRLDHLIDLGVTGFWLGSIYTSPQKDGGYDISNFTDIDPLFGTIRDFEKLIEQAHDKGLKVIMDLVPNHSSDEHPWFINSISRIEPYTDYYVWADGLDGSDGSAPPTNWLSVFGGSAWTWNEERQQYYYHQFDSRQPDLNFRNPKVVQEINDIITFWLEKGVDGFRMNAISHIFEDPDLFDEPINPNPPENTNETDYEFLLHTYTKDQIETYELVYSWRTLLDSYAARTDNVTRLQIVESSSTLDKVIPYQGNGTHKGAHLSFNFGLILNVTQASGASVFINEITSWLNSIPRNSTANWVLGNHDQSRVASRFGINRADGLNMLSLLLPGVAFTYYGEEIAMLDTWISFEDTQDPHGINAGPDRYELFSRDPARTPFQWDNTTSAGFSGNETTWLPVNSNYLIRNLALQASRERSVYKTYKAIVKLKQTETIRRGSTRLLSLSDDNVLTFIRELHDEDTYVIVINLSPYSKTVDLSAFDDLPSKITVCLASANAIGSTGDTVNIDSVSLSANAALVLCTTDFPDTANEEINGDLDWWQTAAIYQIYPKSFKDSNGDGVGDIQGIISQLNYFKDIDIDAIWLGPIYTSPQKDGGYDISNYLDIDPLFGSTEEFETLLDSAHDQGIKVILDFVPNHSSDQHEWFVNSVARVAPYTDYYIWRDGVHTANGTNPPNNWISVFGGSAWTWNEQRQQYYLHQFSTNQPDLNLENQDVIEETNRILRFWLEKGVDGFRIGSVSHLVEDSSFRDEPINENADDSVLESDYDYLEHIYTTNLNTSFDLVVHWRSVIDNYVATTGSQKKFLAVEPTSNTETALRFLGNDTNPGAHAPLNFNIIKNVTRATSSAEIISLITEWLNLLSKNITPNWVLGSHDFNRASSRLGVNRIDGLHMLSLLLPGLSVTYQGEELGLQNVPVSWNQTQDPKGLNAGESRFELFSRDPARTPFLWDGTSNAGFTTGSSTWLPITSDFPDWNLAIQSSENRSYYNTYKSLIEFRKLVTFKRGATKVQSLNDNSVIAFSRELSNEHTYLVVINVDIYRTSVDLTGFDNLLGEDLVVCLASANSITDTGADVNLSEVQLSANAALLVCPRSALPEPVTTPAPTTPAVSTESPVETEPILANDEIGGDLDWWQTAAIYQVYPKSFKDSNGDGVGDIQGIISQLDHFTNISVDAIWLGPVYTSPQYDHGYDVSNYRDVDPLLGTLADLESLLEKAHARGIKIILDFVPNHSSIEHEWFVNSVARVAPYTDYYIWRDGVSTDNGTNPPNNWISVFGGSAWTWNEERQQYYLHQFGTNQPDLNLENEVVVSEIDDILRFWLEKDFDGFRIGSVSHLVEDSSFRDEPINENADDSVLESDYDYLEHIYTTNLNTSFDLVVHWRSVIDNYVATTGSEKKLLAVEPTSNTETALRFLGNDTNPGAHAPLNFNIVKNATSTSSSSELIGLTTEWLNLLSGNVTPNWVLGSHDFDRVSSRFGINRVDGLHMLSLLLPGISVTYQGEELGLQNVPVSWNQTQDPKGLNAGESRFELFSRDPARTPFLWDGTSNAGFTTGSSTWLPVTSNFQNWNLDVQSNAEKSYYNTYKSLIEFRKLETFKRGATKVQSLNDNSVIAFSRELSNEHTYLVVINVDIYRTSVDLTGFDNLLGEDLVVCLASANSITDTGADVNLSEVQLSANAALLVCPRSALPEPVTTPAPTTPAVSTESPVETEPILANDEIGGDLDWWQTAAIYQVYPKSFKDSNGDGVGDIQGIISQLDHFTNISVDAIWLGPVYTSPQYDHGYDVSNYRDVDPLLGTLADLESLLEKAHARGIKIILDFVPNHSSIEHEWFVNSVARVAPYTDYYIWRDGVSTDNGTNPPNNWISVFGGSAWTWNEERQQYYLHQFGTNQPDLNLENEVVVSEIDDILRFWLEKDFDGFRIGSVSHLVEDSSFRDEPINENADDSVLESDYDYLEHIYTTNLNTSFDLVVHWRSVIDNYVATTGSEKKLLAVEPTSNTETALRFLGNDTNPGAHAPLNFNIVKNATSTSSSSELIGLTTEWLNLLSGNVTPNWVLGSHDFDRVSSRFGINRVDGLHMLSLLLPGISVTYQGEELGLQNVPVSWNQTQDPKGLNAGESRFELFSRDPARTPFLWDGTSNAGFTTGSSTWLPVTSNFQNWNLDVQSNANRSYYNTYKSLIEFRKLETFKRGATKIQSLNDNTVIAFTRELSNEPTYAVIINNLFYGTTVSLSGFESLTNEDLVVCLASANSITTTGSNVTISEISLSANAALLLCPRSELPDVEPEATSTSTEPSTPETTSTSTESTTTIETTTEDQPDEPDSDEDPEPDGAINVTFSSLLLVITLLVTFM